MVGTDCALVVYEGFIFDEVTGLRFTPGTYSAAVFHNGESIAYVKSLTLMSTVETIKIPSKFIDLSAMFDIVGDSLTWDGNINGKHCMENNYYRVSDKAPTLAQFSNGGNFNITTYFSGEKTDTNYTFTSENVQGEGSVSALALDGMPVAYFLTAVVEGIPAGTYLYFAGSDTYSVCLSSLTVNGFSFNGDDGKEAYKLRLECLPDNLGNLGSGLPDVTANDNGKTMSVVNGAWEVKQPSYNDLSDKPALFSGNYNDLSNKPTPIPAASSANEGAFLRVVNGAWTAVMLPIAEESEF
jgi:hypothetical protein